MSKKVDPAKLQGVFEKIMEADPENRFCADCHSKNPRWASTNLGVFICIKCAGIHRSIGTHITKVKSISLDGWEESQIAVMRKVGNTNGRRIWEATMPESVQRDRPNENASSSVLDHWIRSKYERKMYFSQAAYDEVFNGGPRAAPAKPAAPIAAPTQGARRPSQGARRPSGGAQPDIFGAPVSAPPAQSSTQSFDSLFGAPVSAPPSAAPAAAASASAGGRPRAPSGGSSSLFGAPVSAPPKSNAPPKQDTTADLLFGAPVSSPAKNTGMGMGMGMGGAPAAAPQQRKDTDSIMALFGPSSSTSQSTSMNMYGGSMPLQPQQAPIQQGRGNYDVDLRAYGVYRTPNAQQQQQMTAQQRAYYQQQLLYQQQQQARYTPNYTRYA